MNILKTNFIIILAATLTIGLLIGFFSPQITSQIIPQKTIFDKLNEAGIPFTNAKDTDFEGHLDFAGISNYYSNPFSNYYKNTANIGGTYNFPAFTNNYQYQNSHHSSDTSLNVYVDSETKIIWIEKVGNNSPTNITALWFYIYTESS